MKSSLDCILCFVRQAFDGVRAVSCDPDVQAAALRELLLRMARIDMNETPPHFAQQMHRHLREATGNEDPYRRWKDEHNRIGLRLLPALRATIAAAPVPLDAAVRLAIAGNAIDMGVRSEIAESDVRLAVEQALDQPLQGEREDFRSAVERAGNILYLADNAGEIAFDRLLVECLGPKRVTVAVRGAPVINDATLADARAVGLDRIVKVIDNGSDAPGTILADCSTEFRRRFAEADLIIAKGQGNLESLSDETREIYFLLKVKCQVIAHHVGAAVGVHLLTRLPRCRVLPGDRLLL